jgi:hypothetical protein
MGTRGGYVVVFSILTAALLTTLALWISAIWYASTEAPQRGVAKHALVAILVFTNFVGAFFYYFLAVRRAPRRHR